MKKMKPSIKRSLILFSVFLPFLLSLGEPIPEEQRGAHQIAREDKRQSDGPEQQSPAQECVADALWSARV